MISETAIEDLKNRNPCDKVAGQWVTLRRGGRLGKVGPCPLHSPDPKARDSTAFECGADQWVCAVCRDGGHVIKLVALYHGLDPKADFLEAVALLGGTIEPDAARTTELERERAVRKDRQQQEANLYRERERRTAFDMWHAGVRWPGTPVEDYLKLRGLTGLPDRLQLRFAPVAAYFHGEHTEAGRKSRRVIHRGPAMLAPIVNAAGKFRAVHMTWLDLGRSKGKALIKDPDTGDELLAKKVRGSKSGNAIRLIDEYWWAALAAGVAPGPDGPSRLYLGEGIETVLSVWFALQRTGRDLAGAAFWSTADLGNLAGKAAASVPHPTLKDAAGRARRVPGPLPDFAAPVLSLPESAADVVLLGDGDSDRLTTLCALSRASVRYSAADQRAT
jgi:hypothetical protein